MFKGMLVLLLIFMVGSLAVGLFFLVRDDAGRPRVVRALTVRIALALVVFALLLLGGHFGWIAAHRA